MLFASRPATRAHGLRASSTPAAIFKNQGAREAIRASLEKQDQFDR
jgi:hypothetical protein